MPHQYSQPAAGGARVAGATRSSAAGASRLTVPGERRDRVAGERPGFTLLELLIVIAIIGILAVVAVFSYVGVQRQATVDFAADTVVSALREARDLSRSGRSGSSTELAPADASNGPVLSQAQCYAVKIVSGPDGGLYTASTNYVAVDGERVDLCETLGDDAGWRRSEALGTRLVITEKLAGGQGAVSEDEQSVQVFYFKPPFGKILGADTGGTLLPVEVRIYVFEIGDPDYPEWDREVLFDTTTGEAKKKLPAKS